MSYAERLNTIHRLRLMRNTTGEMSAHTGIQLRDNSFSKKAPFIARCIYSEFSREVRERTMIDLDALMTDYEAASCYFEKIAKTRKAQTEFHREVLRRLLNEWFADSSETKLWHASAEAVVELDWALLTLLILNILPSFQAKDGDADPNTHLEHLFRLREYFRPLYDDSLIFRFVPYLTELYRDAVRRIRYGELFTRLDLIRFTQEIVANLKNNRRPTSLLQANMQSYGQRICPDLMQGAWVERNVCGDSPVYWQFELWGADYFLSRKEFRPAEKQITETRYELAICQKDGGIIFSLLRQSEVEYLCKGEPIPEQAYMTGVLDIDDLRSAQSIRWTFTTNRYDNFPTELIRLPADKYDRLTALATAEKWTTVCETGDFEYLSVERAVTARHIYVEYESLHEETGEREIVSWYRIPREGLLAEVDIMQTPVAHIRHDGRTYIDFIPFNRAFDVTDDESRSIEGVDIVGRIVVTELADEA